jgi:hypothetical protein
MSSLRLDWCGHDAAKYAVEHWYSRPQMPVGKLAKLGVWEDGIFRGVLIFGCGTGGVTQTGIKLGTGPFGIAELSRIALQKHDAPISRIIAIAVKVLKKAQPGLKLLVSYADPAAGHHGGVYQANGWVYVGKSAPDAMYRDRTGVVHHSRNTSTSGLKMFYGKTVRVIRRGDCIKLPLEPKYKYLMPLDEETKLKIESLRKPYPKRVRSGPADTPVVQTGKGGSTPTRTLQLTQPVDASLANV